MHINARLDGTCGWIFDHEAYKTWSSELDNVGKPKLLWINGHAGTGKTVLSAAIIHKRTEALKQGQYILYCFCSSFAQANAKFEDVIRIWIWQLIQQDPSVVKYIWDEYVNSSSIERGTVASQTEVWKIWKNLLSTRMGCTVVIDGFDEFDRTYRVQSKFLEKVKQVVAQTTTNILITSRNEEDIQHALSPSTRGTSEILMLECLVSKELVRGDLDLLASEVINDVLHNKSDEVKKDLASRLAVRSDGMFLWIKQQNMGQLRPGKPLKQLQQMVDRMPSGLKETYRKIWDEIERREREDKERTLGVLRLIAFAFRPLTIAEVTEALLVKPGYDDLNLDERPDVIDEEYIKSEIKGLCGSLIDIRPSGGSDVPGSRTLHLAHVSVREFLMEELCTRTAKEDFGGKKLREHHTEFAKVCLRYLTYQGTWKPNLAPDQGFQRSFLNYASVWWERHVDLGDELDEDVSKFMDVLLCPDGPIFRGWRASRIDFNPDLQPHHKEQLKKLPGNPLWWVSRLDLKGSVERLLASKPDLINRREHFEGRTPLHTACSDGSLDIIKLLLEKGAGINIQDYYGRTPLCDACSFGRGDIVSFLLDEGADPKIADRDNFSPLFCLCSNGDGDPTPIIHLLEKGADTTINLRTPDGSTCLHLCAWFNLFRIAPILLDRGAKESLYLLFGSRAPIHLAAERRCQEMLKILIDQRCDINTRSPKNITPLHIAAQRNYPETVGLLLDSGAFIEATDGEGRTPLLAATWCGHLDTIELLLARGANERVRDNQGCSLLHFATVAGLFDLVRKLLNSGADPNVTTDKGFTPLHAAASNGHLSMVELLLDHGANILVQSHGLVPLASAAKKDYEDVVRVLLKHKADPTMVMGGTRPLVHWVASSCSTRMFTLLLDAVSDFDLLMQGHSSLLNNAAQGGNTETLKILLDKRPLGCFKPDFEGRTALHLAACGGSLAAFEMLLDLGCNPTAKDSRGRNILHYASMGSSLEVIKRILQLPCSANLLKQETRFTPLHWAAISGNAQVMAALIAAGLEETIAEAKFPKRASEWTPWSLSKFFNNKELLSETESLFKLRNFSPDIAPGKKHYSYGCDSCENVSFFSFEYSRVVVNDVCSVLLAQDSFVMNVHSLITASCVERMRKYYILATNSA